MGGVEGVGFRVSGLGLRVCLGGLGVFGSRIQGCQDFRVQSFRVSGLGSC